LVGELRGAVAVGAGVRRAAERLPRDVLAAGLAWLPVVGLGVGTVAALVAEAVGRAAPGLAGVAGVLVFEAIGGGRPRLALAATMAALGRRGAAGDVLRRLRARPGVLALGAALAALGIKLWAGAGLGGWRTIALLVAPMLGRWAVVVQCHGGSEVHARGPAAALIGRARFREFGFASVTAFAVTLALADGVGLAVVLAAALTTVGLRLNANHRLAGLTGRLLVATSELVETVVLVILAGFAQLNR
jgi:adenosylcobinamide-GDP ribazoletransferase